MTARKRDGRCRHDPKAKAEIVQACLQPGVSMAITAMQYGINANLLRSWIAKRHEAAVVRQTGLAERVNPSPVFVPLQIETAKAQPAPAPAPVAISKLHVRLVYRNRSNLTALVTGDDHKHRQLARTWSIDHLRFFPPFRFIDYCWHY